MINSEPSYEKVLQEHAELREQVADLTAFLKKPRPPVGDEETHTWASTLAARIVKLHDKVYVHFHEEEASGLMVDLRHAYPHAEKNIRALMDEHREILAGFRALLDAAMRYCENTPPEDARLRRRVQRLIDKLARHEARETALVQALINQDIGVKD